MHSGSCTEGKVVDHAAPQGGHHRDDRDEKERGKDAGDQRSEHGHRQSLSSPLYFTAPPIPELERDTIQTVGQRCPSLPTQQESETSSVRPQVVAELVDHLLPRPTARQAIEGGPQDPSEWDGAGSGCQRERFGRDQAGPDRQAQHVEHVGQGAAQLLASPPTTGSNSCQPDHSSPGGGKNSHLWHGHQHHEAQRHQHTSGAVDGGGQPDPETFG